MTTFAGFDSGADPGPWVTWHPQASKDGALPPNSWALRDGEGRSVLDSFRQGFVIDWPSLKTGWQYTTGQTGVAPQWRWNQSPAHFEPSPGAEWKRGLSVALALGPELRAVWEQAGFAAWSALCELMQTCIGEGQKHLPQLPMFVWTGQRSIPTPRGPTSAPTFRFVRFVARPGCLAPPGGNGFDTAISPASPPPSRSAPPAPGGPPWRASSDGRQPAEGKAPDDLNDLIPF
jgi:hypothetical protein